MNYIAIDVDALNIISVAPTAEQALLWAEIKSPNASVALICDGKSLSILREEELRTLVFNTTGAKVKGGTYGQVLEYIKDRLQTLPCDNTPAEELLKRLKSNVEVCLDQPSPRAGTATGAVWKICRDISDQYSSLSEKEIRQKIIDRCCEEGINFSTASTQYARWKKSLGY